MTPNEYQKLALRTANYNDRYKDLINMVADLHHNKMINISIPDCLIHMIRNLRISNWAMGLSGESGELTDYLKKCVHHDHEPDIDHVEKELGDICWYIAVLANEYCIDFGSILEKNIEKLKARYPDGFKTTDSINRKDK